MLQRIKQYAMDTHYRRMPEPATKDITVQLYKNVVQNNCGDEISLHCVIKNDCIYDICYQGDGCSLFSAVSYVVCRQLHTMQETKAVALVQQVLRYAAINTDSKEITGITENIDPLVLHALSAFSGRQACILLPWQAAESCLLKKGSAYA